VREAPESLSSPVSIPSSVTALIRRRIRRALRNKREEDLKEGMEWKAIVRRDEIVGCMAKLS